MDRSEAGETLAQMRGRLAAEAGAAYKASEFSTLSRDTFSRFSRDRKAQAGPNEVLVDATWQVYQRWLEVLKDEKQNATEALPIAEADVRLDFYFDGDHSFSHTIEMIRAKLRIVEQEISAYLPSLWQKYEEAVRGQSGS